MNRVIYAEAAPTKIEVKMMSHNVSVKIGGTLSSHWRVVLSYLMFETKSMLIILSVSCAEHLATVHLVAPAVVALATAGSGELQRAERRPPQLQLSTLSHLTTPQAHVNLISLLVKRIQITVIQPSALFPHSDDS